jgi:competence protein ComEA
VLDTVARMGIRERLDALSRAELTGLIVVVVVTLAGAGFWYTRSLPKPVQVASSPAPAAVAPDDGAPAFAAVSGSPVVSAAPLIVDVTGWVRNPGVYEFAAGDRVIDAVNRAGGAREGADLSVINLAAPLADGTQVVVSKEGETPAGATAGAVSGVPGSGALVNINTASETELETLNGVGPVTAAAIIQYRTENGPFATVDDLMDVSGIGPATLEELRPQVTV